jgi:lipopolysaccharide biosynthesis glycosyltransferase
MTVNSKQCIATIFDQNMTIPASVLVQSIIDNYFSVDSLDIICVFLGSKSDLSALERLMDSIEKDSRVSIKIIDLTRTEYAWIDSLRGVTTKHHAPPLVDLCKLFLGSILFDYNKVIYLDTDMLVVRDIQPILEHPSYNKLMSIVDISGPEYYYLKSQGHFAHINTGFMVINLDWWRTFGAENLFLEHLKKDTELSMSAEELINIYIKPYWSPVPFTFNFFQFTRDIYGIPNYDESNIIPQHYKHAIVFHFVGAAKPWNFKEMVNRDDSSLLGERWRRLAKPFLELDNSNLD